MKIGQYEILDTLGEGACGRVYRARHGILQREVALKIVDTGDGSRSAADRRARFLREARAAAQLAHPNVVAVYEVGERGSQACIAMELVTGTSLRARLRAGRLPEREAIE